MKISLPRIIAYDCFCEVMNEKKKPEEVLERLFAQNADKLRRLDRNFCKELVFGTLRWYSKMYWILQNTSKRDLATTSMEVRAALLIGTYQIFYMDRVADRAAVNESVEYLRHKAQAQATSFANGILRQIARKANYFPKPDKEKLPVEYLALQFSHPEWLVRRWFERFKFEALEQMLLKNNEPPPYSVRMNQLKIPFAQSSELQTMLLRDEKNHSERRPLRSSLRLKNFPSLDETSLLTRGFITLQDESSQLIAPMLQPEVHHRILDMCSGPGGKLSHIFELTEGKAEITAIERSKTAMRRLKETVSRVGAEDGTIKFVEDDALNFEDSKGYDRILIDAPCSGLGVLRRHPEGKWHKSEGIVAELALVQRKLLLHGWKLLKKGGRLVYSVCSSEPEEALEHLRFIQKEFEGKIRTLDANELVPDYYKRYVTRESLLLLFPGNQDDMDGFSAFSIEKLV